MPASVDAIVIGAGPNGLVAANALAEAGWETVLLEEQAEVGGAVRSGTVTADGYVTDLFSAFYPLAAASPIIRDLELDEHGLVWMRSPDVLAHHLDDGRAAVLYRDPQATAADLDAEAPGDGDAWLAMFDEWRRISDDVLAALFTPFPPLRPGSRLLRHLKVDGAARLARLAATPVRRLGQERFRGESAPLLLTGNALHADIPPDAAGSGLYGWLLTMLGQDVGFPVPEGGSGMLASALARRATVYGADVRTSSKVTRILLRDGRADAVRLQDGTVLRARRAILADVTAPALYNELLGPVPLPRALRADMASFQWDPSTLKMNWALSAPVPWQSPAVARSATVHLGVDLDGFVDFSADLSVGRAPRRPFVLFGQMATADPTRAPAGGESAWAYTHLPRSLARDARAVRRQVRRMEEAVERVAPGFADLVVASHVQTPLDLQDSNASLSLGAINAGTAALHQQLVFRPSTGLARPETPVEGLYLAGASAHPGGGVHGACGWNAARAALRDSGGFARLRAALVRTAWGRVLGE